MTKTTNDDNLPRGHAFIRMRNRGYRIDIDFPEVDSAWMPTLRLMPDEAAILFAAYFFEAVLLAGGDRSTAHKCLAAFWEGLEREHVNRSQASPDTRGTDCRPVEQSGPAV